LRAVRRPLLGLATAFGVGCLLSDGRAAPAEALTLALLAGAALVLALLAPHTRPALASLVAAALALGASARGVDAMAREVAGLRGVGLAAGVHRVTGTLVDDPDTREGRTVLLLEAEAIVRAEGQSPTSGRLRVEVGGENRLARLLAGDRVSLWTTLRPAPTLDGPAAAFGYCKSARLVERLPPDRGSLRRLGAGVRDSARRAIEASMPPGTERGLVQAMVLGDRSEIGIETEEAFKAAGTYHVLALSGAQVALLAALLAGGLRFLVAGPWLVATLTSGAVACYAAFVGGDVPIARAALMASALLLGKALDLDADAANLLGVAALVLLALDPASVADVGLQLSFGATLGILVLVPPLTRGVPRLPFRLEIGLAASVAAQCALFPLLAAHFHRLSPAAVVLNVAAVPLSSAVLLSGFAVLLLYPIGAGPAAGAVAWWAARALRASADLGVAGEWLDLRIPAPTMAVLALHCVGIGWLVRGRRLRGLGAVGAAHAWLALGPFAPSSDGRLHLTVVDVGQGEALLLRSPSGRAIAVDAGGSRDRRYDPGERRVAPRLWTAGVGKLDALVVSHAHPDHVGGIPFLLKAFRVSEVWEGPAAPLDPGWRRFEAALARARVTRLALARGAAREWEGTRITVLAPEPRSGPAPRVRNEDSVVIEIGYGDVRLLLTGDTTQEAERLMRLAPADVLLVPHHGSSGSSSPTLVQATRPRLAVVSVGARNPFGHPRPEVLERYRTSGAVVLRTDRDGDVEVATDGRAVWARVAGEGQERRIR
jgi:competence protein ComEC